MQIIKHLHTAILVSNLEVAENFYSNVLGLSKIDRILKYPGAWYQVGDFQIHLILHSNLKTDLQNKEKWGRNPHIAIAVINLDEAKERLQAYGVPIQISASGRAALFTQDPDGNIIEISQV
ncbi:MAG: glyoxalase [Moorea sp. SIO2B7]|nr:glyoxalase [Moorena sp. SIO2B7]